MQLRYTSHARVKASTAKQTCLDSLLGLELDLHSVIRPSGAIPVNWTSIVQLVPSHLLMLAFSFPDDIVTRSGRIGFILGVWLPLETI